MHVVPTFTVSPWEMFKAFPLRAKATLVVSALRMIRDPDRTQELFTIGDLFYELGEVDGKNGIKEYVHSVFEMPGVRANFDAGYLPRPADVAALALLPEGTLGRAFADHMLKHSLSVEFYPAVEVIDEMSYLELRARQTHDIAHVVTGFSTSVPDELGLQAFAVAQIASPMSAGIIGGGLIHAAFFKPWMLYDCLAAVHRGVEMGRRASPLLAYRFEEKWEHPLADVRRELLGEVA